MRRKSKQVLARVFVDFSLSREERPVGETGGHTNNNDTEYLCARTVFSSDIGYVFFGPNPSLPQIWRRRRRFLPEVGPSYPRNLTLGIVDGKICPWISRYIKIDTPKYSYLRFEGDKKTKCGFGSATY